MKQKLPDSNSERDTGLTVERILSLKKSERPSKDVWNGFDEKLHRRIFEVAVKRRESRIANFVAAVLHSRLTYAATATASAVLAIGLFFARGTAVVTSPAPALRNVADIVVSVEAPAPAAKVSGLERFVVDRLGGPNVGSADFRKVMASQAMMVSTAGSTRYVADQVGAYDRDDLCASTSF